LIAGEPKHARARLPTKAPLRPATIRAARAAVEADRRRTDGTLRIGDTVKSRNVLDLEPTRRLTFDVGMKARAHGKMAAARETRAAAGAACRLHGVPVWGEDATMRHFFPATVIVIAGLLSAAPGQAQTGAVPSKEDRVMFRDKDGVSLIVTRAGAEQRDLHLEIKGGAFNFNQTRLEGAEARRFVAGLQKGEYQLSRTLADGTLEFVTAQAGSAAAKDRTECVVSIKSSSAGSLRLGTFRCDSLDDIARRVAALMPAQP
jgi:hypothetical protein